MVWTTLTTIAVPANKTTEWVAAGSVSGTFRARISTPVTDRTVTVVAVRPEELSRHVNSCRTRKTTGTNAHATSYRFTNFWFDKLDGFS
jgi:hypothetical protein